MNKTQLIKWSFKLLCAIVLCGNIVNAQDDPKPEIEVINDENFKSNLQLHINMQI